MKGDFKFLAIYLPISFVIVLISWIIEKKNRKKRKKKREDRRHKKTLDYHKEFFDNNL